MTSELQERDRNLAIEGSKLHKTAKPLPDELVPKIFYLVQKFDDETGDALVPRKRLADFLVGGGFFIVSARAVDVLREYDLGHGRLEPVDIHQPDRATRVGSGWHVWTLGAQRSGLSREASGELWEVAPGVAIWNVPLNPRKTPVAVYADLVEGGADVWIDPQLFQGVFFSHALGKRLIAEGLGNAFRLYECKMV
jgi:hypothetical protein